VFFDSLANINKALVPKKQVDPYTILLVQYYKYLSLFLLKNTKKLLLLYKKGINYLIKLEVSLDKKEKEVL
jgi:hypothetical protein